MPGRISVRSLFKAMLALNGASIVRGIRLGPEAGLRSMQAGYQAIDPFSTKENSPERVLLRRIPQRQLEEIVPLPHEIVIGPRYAMVNGSTPVEDVVAIIALAIAQRPKAVLEFGTFFGSTTATLARNLPDAAIHTIDLPPECEAVERLIAGRPVDDMHLIAGRELGKAFVGTELERRIVQHVGDTAAYDYGAIRDEVSFFLIDGSHTYEYAKIDTLKAFELAKGPSTFVWHDCDDTHPGVTRWLGELLDARLPVCRVGRTVVACLRVDDAEMKLVRRSFVD